MKSCVNDEINLMVPFHYLNAVSTGEETLKGSSCVCFHTQTQQKLLQPKMLTQFLDCIHGRLVQSPLFCHFHIGEQLRKMEAMCLWRLGYSEQCHPFLLRPLFLFYHQGQTFYWSQMHWLWQNVNKINNYWWFHPCKIPAAVCEDYAWIGQERVWLILLWSYPDIESCYVQWKTLPKPSLVFYFFLSCSAKLNALSFLKWSYKWYDL